MKKYELLYISGQITNQHKGCQSLNVQRGKHYARKWFKNGFAIHCPHLQTNGFQDMGKWKDFIYRDLAVLSKCDGIVMIPGWRYSKGALVEHMFASANQIPIIHDDEQVAGVTQYPQVGDIVYLPKHNYTNGGMALVTKNFNSNGLYRGLHIKTDVDKHVSYCWCWSELEPLQRSLFDKFAGKWAYPILY